VLTRYRRGRVIREEISPLKPVRRPKKQSSETFIREKGLGRRRRGNTGESSRKRGGGKGLDRHQESHTRAQGVSH